MSGNSISSSSVLSSCRGGAPRAAEGGLLMAQVGEMEPWEDAEVAEAEMAAAGKAQVAWGT